MILEMAADAFGDRVAIGNADDGLSYEGLRRAARAIADRVEDSGAKHLALIEPNSPLVPAALFGAAWAGVSYAPLNYRLPDASLQELIAPHRAVDHRGLELGRRQERLGAGVPRVARAPGGAAVHERHVGRAEGRAARARPAARVRVQHGRVRVGGRGRGVAHVVAAVPHRRRHRDAELHLQRPAGGAAAGRALLARGLDRHRPARVGHARVPRAHDARPHRRHHEGRPRRARSRACAASCTAAPACPRRCSKPRSSSSPRPTS